ncbi:MAG: CCDC90 family protein [Magnetococcus sp. YQC-3]
MSAATSTEGGYKSASFVFDSYAYVRRLRDAGMDEQQAAIQAETFMALAEDRLATKQDIAELKRDIDASKAELKRDIAESNVRIATLEANLKRDIETAKAELQKEISVGVANAKTEIIKWVVGMGVVILGGMMTINRVFPPVPAYYPYPAQEIRQPAPPPAFKLPHSLLGNTRHSSHSRF